jgi:hypothetical protein
VCAWHPRPSPLGRNDGAKTTSCLLGAGAQKDAGGGTAANMEHMPQNGQTTVKNVIAKTGVSESTYRKAGCACRVLRNNHPCRHCIVCMLTARQWDDWFLATLPPGASVVLHRARHWLLFFETCGASCFPALCQLLGLVPPPTRSSSNRKISKNDKITLF